MTVLVELARRAVSHPQTSSFVKRAINGNGGRTPDYMDKVSIWSVVAIYVTIFIAAIGISLFSYMLNQVVVTLCMVESPVAAITVTHETSNDKEDSNEKETLLEAGPTITLVNAKPITASIRATVRHLVAHAGRWSRFRGFKIHCFYSFLSGLTTTFFSGALSGMPGSAVVGAAISAALLANVHAAWTHKVVAMPTDGLFWQRIPSKAHWKTLAVPAALKAVMPYVSMYLTAGVFMLLKLNKLGYEGHSIETCADKIGLIARVLAVIVFAITCTLFLCLPAMVTLVRIEASLLPEDQDTIVPFDRTFGGKVVSKIMGGTGVVGFLDAWRSFNWEARRRLIKLFTKNFFIMVGMFVFVLHVVAIEAFVFMGEAAGEILAHMHREMAVPN
ncbi:hypothetical protein GT037_008243 [Alternaria burnsii]|uniref:Uncharacterized protein n=1 Tax=Alternaria burnsii TaxID=1187904 RepID=A0A8H7EBI3_9PLEO|nr:uncharacterized protein GT037_008243 [Alternaria burnsii]KAF7673628.1 hypothetical protein GT037_008243 [Alternaria burnsii]